MDEETVMRPMAEPLELAALEVKDLVRMAASIEGLMSELFARCGPVEADLMVRAQSADLLGQRLSGLQAYLEALSEGAPPEARIDVTAAVLSLVLAEQAHRLGIRPTPTPANDGDDDLLLFEG